MVSTLIIRVIERAIMIILLLPAPNNIINKGPNATLGIELSIVKNGSNILNKILNSNSTIDMIKLKIILKVKDIIVSFNVTKMWLVKLFSLYRTVIHLIIFEGEENTKGLIMALSITLIINVLTIYNGFLSSDKYLNKLLDTLKASRIDKLKYLIIPSAYSIIINSLKINISMTLIGVIMGEFLVSKAGIGYLIIYGTQVFNLTLVMTGIVILMFISYILYIIISKIEKIFNQKISN